MNDLSNDLRHALRMFAKNPGFTLTAVAALALGIGANTAIFTVVNAVLLKPLSYPQADRMVEFGTRSTTLANFLSNVTEFHACRRLTNVFQEVAAYDPTGPGFNLAGDRPEQLHGIHVTEGYFRLFGASTVVGRTFTPAEDLPHGGKVVVLSYGLWQRKFAGDPSIAGKQISLGNEPYTVVGVIGQQFLADPPADIWLPFQFDPASNDMNLSFHIAGRLRPELTLAQARAQLALAGVEYHREFPNTNPTERFQIEPLRDTIVGDARNSLLALLGAVTLVLLISCANVANLLLVRATGRKQEFAIRCALGAGRNRIVRQLLTESLLLALAGGALGTLLGFAGVRALLALSPAGLPRIGENGAALSVDWRVLCFTIAVSFITGILFGLLPAFSASRTDLNSALKESSSRSGPGVRQGKVRSLLVISEVSLALVLLIGSALLIRAFLALHQVEPGFSGQNVLTLEMSLNGERFQKSAGVAQLLKSGRDRLNALPDVKASAAGYWLPNQVDDGLPFQIAGHPVDKNHEYGSRWMSITPDYLQVFAISVLRGRNFNENDTAAAPQVAIINQALAKRYFPGEDPVGRQLFVSKGLGPALNESAPVIVGVAGDTHNAGLGLPADPMVMVPIPQVTDGYAAAYSNIQPLIWAVETRGEPHASISAIAEQLRLASGGFPVAHVRTMDEVLGRSTARERFNMMLLTIFGAAALVLAAIGVYGLMAYSVAQRTQEMGIRMALGADRALIRKIVVWHGMTLVAAGVVIGIGTAFALARLMASFLFEVKPWDPIAFLSAPLILGAVALVAVWLPANRASRIDPIKALRAE